MKRRSWMSEDHIAFQDTVRSFLDTELKPRMEELRRKGLIPHELWTRAGELGILGASIPEAHGGSGLARSFDAVTFLEQTRMGDSGWGISVHGFVAHYISAYGTEEQKQRWLPGLATGERIAAIAMTEPEVGSNLQGVRTTAVADGDAYVINGSKIFITNGQVANLVCVVAKTDPSAGARGVSLIMVETDEAPGFKRGRNLEKLGMKRSDTSELFFEDVRVPKSNLLGGVEGQGFVQLMQQLDWERLTIGILAVGTCERALEVTKTYVDERKVFGKRVMDMQNTRFKLAEAATLTEVLRTFVDSCIEDYDAGDLTRERAAMAKWWGADTQCKVVDECLQLFGGYGYMMEYPIAEMYADSRAQKIYGGTNEIMKEIIARGIDVGGSR